MYGVGLYGVGLYGVGLYGVGLYGVLKVTHECKESVSFKRAKF